MQMLKKQIENQWFHLIFFVTIEFDPLFLLIELNIRTKIYSAHKTAHTMVIKKTPTHTLIKIHKEKRTEK